MDINDIRRMYPDTAGRTDTEIVNALAQRSGMSPEALSDYLGYKEDKNFASDTAIDLTRGVVGIGQGVVGLANLASGGGAGQMIRDSFGGDLGTVQDKLGRMYSSKRLDANQNVENAQGFMGTASALLHNPRALIGQGIEAIPSMAIPVGLGGKAASMALKGAEGVTSVAERAALQKAAQVAGNRAQTAGWAGLTAGQTAEKIERENPGDAAAMYEGALGAGAAVGAITHGFSFLPGGHMADQAAGAAKRYGQSVANQSSMMAGMGAASTVAENAATGHDLTRGLPEALGAGAVSGAAFGLMGGRRRADLIGGNPEQPANVPHGSDTLPTSEFTNPGLRGQSVKVAGDEPLYVTPHGDALTGQQLPAYQQFGSDPGRYEQMMKEATLPRTQLDPAAEALAASQQQSSGKAGASDKTPPPTPEELQQVYAVFGHPQEVAHTDGQHVLAGADGKPVMVTHFANSHLPIGDKEPRGPYLGLHDPELHKDIAKLVEADRQKPAGQRAAEVVAARAVREVMGRDPHANEIKMLMKAAKIEVASDPEHIRIALQQKLNRTGSSPKAATERDFITEMLKQLPEQQKMEKAPELESALLTEPQAPAATALDAARAKHAKQDAAVQQAMANIEARKAAKSAPAASPADTLGKMADAAGTQGTQVVTYTDHNGKTRTLTKQAYMAKLAGFKDKDLLRLQRLTGMDAEGHLVNPPMTHAEAAAAEGVSTGAISNWAKDHNITEEVVTRIAARPPETMPAGAEAEFLNARGGEGEAMNPGFHVADNVSEIHKAGLMDPERSAMQRAADARTDQALARMKEVKHEPSPEELARDAEMEAKRKAAAAENAAMMIAHAEASPNKERAARNFNAMREKGMPRFEELRDEDRAKWVAYFDANEMTKLHGGEDGLDGAFKDFKEHIDEHYKGEPADRGGAADHGGPGDGESVRPADGQAGHAADEAAGVGTKPVPVIVKRTRRTAREPAAGQELKAQAEAINKGRRNLLIAAAAVATHARADELKIGRAVPLTESVLRAKVSPEVEKLLRNGRSVSDLKAAMAKIAESGPVGLRALAAATRDLLPSSGARIEVDDKSTLNMHGVVSVDATPKLTLYTAEGRRGLTYGTLIHESQHLAVLARYAQLSMGIIRGNDKVLGMSAPHAAKALEQFKNVWLEFKHLANDVKESSDQLYTSVAEARQSPDEFFVRSLTDPTLQQYLASKKYEGRTLWERFKDWVKTSLFGNKSGVEASWLDAALTASNDLVQAMKGDAPNFARFQTTRKYLADHREVIAVPAEAERRGIVKRNIRRLPPALRPTATKMSAAIHEGAMRAGMASAFLPDLADWAGKHGMPAMKKISDVMSRKGALKNELDKELGKIVRHFQHLPEEAQAKVQKFLMDSTTEQKWGYQPEWRSDAKVDAGMAARYDELTPQEKAVVESVLKHGNDMWDKTAAAIAEKTLALKQESVATAIKDGAEKAEIDALWHEIEQEVAKVPKRLDGPYVPLTRFGSHAVTVKSNELLDAKKNDPEQYRSMLHDPEHYRVEFADGAGEAELRREELAKAHPDATVEASRREDAQYLGASYEALEKLAQRVKASKEGESEADAKLSRATYHALHEAIIQSLGEYHARSTQLRRKNVAGVNPDEIMRGFATRGYAANRFLATVAHGAELHGAIQELRQQKDDGGDRAAKQLFYNELMARQTGAVTADTPRWIGHFMRFTTLWKLVTSPAYYLQYVSQPITMFMPLVAGEHGGTAAWREMIRSVGDVKAIANGLHEVDLSQVKDANERRMLEDLRTHGTIEMGHEQSFGQLQTLPEKGFSKAWAKATDLATSIPRSVEMHNRIMSALTVYRLERAKGADHETATSKARSLVHQAYGDYSAYAAPRIMGKGVMRLATQYRQFQLIHTALLARLLHNAFGGEHADVRKAAKIQLAYMAGHYGVLAGGLGIPAAHLISAALRTAFGDDEDKDDETFIKRHVNNKFVADMLIGGVPRAVLGQDLGTRMGAGDILSPFRYANMSDTFKSKAGYADTALAMMGPFIGSMVPQVMGGVNMIEQGDYYRGLEQLMPKGIADVMKGARYAEEGVASKRGQTTLSSDDLSAADLLGTALGSRSSKIADAQREAKIVGDTMQEFKDAANAIKGQYVRARKSGEDASALVEKWKALAGKMREAGVKPHTLGELYMAPAKQAGRDRQVIDGVAFQRTNKGLVQAVTGDEE